MDSILIVGGETIDMNEYGATPIKEVYGDSQVLLTRDCSLPNLPNEVVQNALVLTSPGAGKKQVS